MAVSIFKRPLNKEVEQIKSDIGIVENGTTAMHNISSGQYVIWKGNLCIATSAISSGDTLSSSNLTEVSNGGLNALNGKINSIGDDYTLLGTIVASGSGWRTKDITSLSGYRFIMIALGINGGSGSFSTEFFPLSYFKTFTSSTNFCASNFHFGSNDVQFSCYYISDTSIGINTDGMTASVNAAKIYGIK